MNCYITLHCAFHPKLASLSLKLCYREVNCDEMKINCNIMTKKIVFKFKINYHKCNYFYSHKFIN